MERTAAEWFAEARRWYIEEHQGCPRCQARHCVFRSQWGQRVEYHCTACDFSTAHDGQTSRFCVGSPGSHPGIRLSFGIS
jgi:hypothetical protein